MCGVEPQAKEPNALPLGFALEDLFRRMVGQRPQVHARRSIHCEEPFALIVGATAMWAPRSYPGRHGDAGDSGEESEAVPE